MYIKGAKYRDGSKHRKQSSQWGIGGACWALGWGRWGGELTVTAHCNGSAYKLSAHARDTKKEMTRKNGLDKAEKEKKK